MPLLTVLPDDSVLASGDITKSDTYDLTFRDVPKWVTAIRLEALPHPLRVFGIADGEVHVTTFAAGRSRPTRAAG